MKRLRSMFAGIGRMSRFKKELNGHFATLNRGGRFKFGSAAGFLDNSKYSISTHPSGGLLAEVPQPPVSPRQGVIVLQERAVAELLAAADAISSPSDFAELSRLENTGQISRMTLLRAQVEWIKEELLGGPSAMVIISGLDPQLPSAFRKRCFGIISSLLGPVIKSRFDYLQSFHTDGALYRPQPPKYLGWCILGENREAIRLVTISADEIDRVYKVCAPRLIDNLYRSFPFDSGMATAQLDTKIAANGGQFFTQTGRQMLQRSSLPILSVTPSGLRVRYDRPSLERGFRSIGIDSRMFEAATTLFTILDTEINPTQVLVRRGEMLFIDNHRLVHSREPITGRNSTIVNGNTDAHDTICRSWIEGEEEE